MAARFSTAEFRKKNTPNETLYIINISVWASRAQDKEVAVLLFKYRNNSAIGKTFTTNSLRCFFNTTCRVGKHDVSR